MTKELIGPVIVKGRAGEIDATGVGVVAGNDCDIGNGGGVGQGEESNQNSEGEECYPMIIFLSLSIPWPTVGPRRFGGGA